MNKTKQTRAVKTRLSLEQRQQDGELKKREGVLFAIGNDLLKVSIHCIQYNSCNIPVYYTEIVFSLIKKKKPKTTIFFQINIPDIP